MRLSGDEFKALIEAGRERPNLEFKQSGAWTETAFRIKIIKAILAMSNIRDGGRIVIGMERQADTSYVSRGVDPSHLGSFKEEEMQDKVGEYAAPYASFQCTVQPHDSKQFVLISVDEFDQIPVICKREFSGELRRGAVYVRSRSQRPQSIEVSSEADMREILDLAIDKGIRRMRTRGYEATGLRDPLELYDQEIGDLGQ